MSEIIFDLIDIHVQNYMKSFNLDYDKANSNKEVNENITFYEVYTNMYSNLSLNQKLECRLVIYSDKSIFNISCSRIGKDGYVNSVFHVDEYFYRYKNLPELKFKFFLSNNLETLDAELKQFFEWLASVTDAQLINILQGKDWVDIPFDWEFIGK